MPVIINDRNTINLINRLSGHIGNRRTVMRTIANQLREYVRTTIRVGGRPTPFAPLSRWTSLRTGRHRPFLSLLPNFRAAHDNDTATVSFRAHKPFTLEQHAKGYRIPERVGLMRVPVLGGGAIYFRRARTSLVPARRVWPTAPEARKVVRETLNNWIRRWL